MKNKFFLLFCLLLLLSFKVDSQDLVHNGNSDVNIGNLYVVTIDNSGSMKTCRDWPYPKSESIAKNVSHKFYSYPELLGNVNYDYDRFLFFVSGYGHGQDSYGKKLRAAPAFDKSFIHHTDKRIHSFSSDVELRRHIRNLMYGMTYDYQNSFVSQMRTFSLIKAVNYMREIGEEDTYLNVFVITITDDGDQHDQWQRDYTELRKIDPNKIEMVKDSNTKYFYNPFNSLAEGSGVLDEEYAYDKDKDYPHIWLYKYETKQYQQPLDRSKLLAVAARDGNTTDIKSRKLNVTDGTVEAYLIDQIIVNDDYLLDTCLRITPGDNFTLTSGYDNSFWINKVDISGRVLIQYYDTIYGNHYRYADFYQSSYSFPTHFFVILSVVKWVLVIIILLFLIFRFVILPFSTLTNMFLPSGEHVRVRRGFAFLWKSRNIPLVSLVTGSSWCSLVAKHPCIKVSKGNATDSSVFFISSHELNFSCNIESYSSKMDIEGYFFARSGLYPDCIKKHYRNTFYYYLWKWKKNQTPVFSNLCSGILNVVNFVCPIYYYLYKPASQSEKVWLEATTILPDRYFTVETQVQKNNNRASSNDCVNALVSSYYKNYSYPNTEVLIGHLPDGSHTKWLVLQLRDATADNDSLLSIKVLMEYSQPKVNDSSEISQIERRLVKFVKSNSSFRRIKCVCFDARDCCAQFPYRIVSSSATAVVSFVEANPQKLHVAQLYSPLKDSERRNVFVKLNPRWGNGRLYYSLLPIDNFCIESKLCCFFSDDLVRTNVVGTRVMELKNNVIKFDGTEYKL